MHEDNKYLTSVIAANGDILRSKRSWSFQDGRGSIYLQLHMDARGVVLAHVALVVICAEGFRSAWSYMSKYKLRREVKGCIRIGIKECFVVP